MTNGGGGGFRLIFAMGWRGASRGGRSGLARFRRDGGLDGNRLRGGGGRFSLVIRAATGWLLRVARLDAHDFVHLGDDGVTFFVGEGREDVFAFLQDGGGCEKAELFLFQFKTFAIKFEAG